ncbi:MAG: hypothetical protein ABI559_12915 [Chloroflexota bacterium]
MDWEFVGRARLWYRQANERDEKVRQLSEDFLGDERDVFVVTMTMNRHMLDLFFKDGPLADETVKAKVAIADRANTLLWSSWNDILCGRYSSAAEHWRSLLESPQFMAAFGSNEALTKSWISDPGFDIHSARTAVVKWLRDSGRASESRKWFSERTRDHKEVQLYSHVTPQSCLGPLATDGKHVLMRNEPSAKRTRECALFLAKDALELMRSLWWAFPNDERVNEAWDKHGAGALEWGARKLTQVYGELGLDCADPEEDGNQ